LNFLVIYAEIIGVCVVFYVYIQCVGNEWDCVPCFSSSEQ